MRQAGAGLLHPLPIAAIVLLAANDHLFKAWWPGAVTGKLSDIAGLAFFPLLLQAAWEIAGGRVAARAVLAACAVATGAVFALANALPAADHAYEIALGTLQWPAYALVALAGGEPLPALARVAHVADTGDLLALPALLLAFAARRPAAAVGSRSGSDECAVALPSC